MNESMSIFLATTILALGGLGLYMVKSSDEVPKECDEEYNEEGFFGWGSNDETEKEKEKEKGKEEIEPEYDEEIKPRRRATKTQRNRKSTGSSKRRYY
jgi:hypothetical protein